MKIALFVYLALAIAVLAFLFLPCSCITNAFLAAATAEEEELRLMEEEDERIAQGASVESGPQYQYLELPTPSIESKQIEAQLPNSNRADFQDFRTKLRHELSASFELFDQLTERSQHGPPPRWGYHGLGYGYFDLSPRSIQSKQIEDHLFNADRVNFPGL